MPQYTVTVTYRNQQRKNKKGFSVFRKKSKAKNKKLTTTFGKSFFLIKYRMRYVIYMPANTKDLAITQTMVAYGNRQNATAFGRANNSDLLRSLKHLIETRLYNDRTIHDWLKEKINKNQRPVVCLSKTENELTLITNY